GRQGKKAALVQLEQEGARRHVLQLPRSVVPVPMRRQRLRQTAATPTRILPHPLTEHLQVQFAHRPALHDKTFAHGLENKPGKSGVQSKMKKSSNPVPRPPGSTLDPVNEQGQFLWPQTQALALSGHRRKSSAFQPFDVENQARTIPEKDLEP